MTDLITWEAIKRAAEILKANQASAYQGEWYMIANPDWFDDKKMEKRYQKYMYLRRYHRRSERMKKGRK